MTPAGSLVKVRTGDAAFKTVEKLTGLLKVTVIALGVTVTVEPLAGLVDATRSRVDGVDGADGVDQAVAGPARRSRRARRSSAVAESISPWRICAG